MKFILNESNAKYILKEKFILNEEDLILEAVDYSTSAIQNAKALSDNITKILTKIKDLASKTHEEGLAVQLRTLQDASKPVEVMLKTPTIPADEKLDVYTEYLAALEKFFQDVVEPIKKKPRAERPENFLDDAQDLDDDIKAFKDILTATPFDAPAADAKYKELSAAVNAVQTKTTTDTQNSDLEKLDDLRKTLTSRLNKLKPIVSNLAKAFPPLDKKETAEERNAVLEDFINASKEVYDAMLPIANNTATDISGQALLTLIEDYEKLNAALNLLEQNKFISKPLNDTAEARAKKEADKAEEKARKALSGTDWAKLYSQCTNKPEFDAFWDKYFAEEWGANADAVKSFEGTFTNDLKEIGWDAITNPIIGFLKKDSIKKLLGNKFNKFVYVTLHNALARGELSLKDFNEKNTSNSFGDANVIFNMDFYNKSPNEMEAYLKAQYQLNSRSSYLPGELAAAYNKDQNTRKIILSNIILDRGKISNLTDEAVKSAIIKGNLRPVTTVQQVLAKNVGASAENAREAASDKDIEECLKRINGKDNALKVLAYLYSVFSASDAETQIRKLDNHTTMSMADIYDTYTPKAAEVLKIRNVLPLKNKTLQPRQIEQLLTGLAKTAGILKEKESK